MEETLFSFIFVAENLSLLDGEPFRRESFMIVLLAHKSTRSNCIQWKDSEKMKTSLKNLVLDRFYGGDGRNDLLTATQSLRGLTTVSL